MTRFELATPAPEFFELT